jgi:uncharacterized protein (TIGR02594 family)
MLYLPPWLRLAQQEAMMGREEIHGSFHNSHIVAYGKAVGLFVTDDELPWCSNFINWLFLQLDMKRTDSARARSWLEWGIPLQNPALGAVCVLSRGPGVQPGKNIIEAPGHVGLLTDMLVPDSVTLLGGNQGNRVCERTYSLDRVLDLRWPG